MTLQHCNLMDKSHFFSSKFGKRTIASDEKVDPNILIWVQLVHK